MKLKLILITIILSLTANYSLSQTLSEGLGSSTGNLVKFQGGSDQIDLDYAEIDGNPFMDEGWLISKLFLKDGTEFEDVPLMYNIMENHLIAQRNDEPVVLFNNLIEGFKVKDTDAYYTNGYHSDKFDLTKSEFVKQIYENDDLAIIEIYDAEIFTEQADGYSSMTNVKRFSKSSTIAIKVGNNDFEKLKLKEKKILKALPYPKKEIKNIAEGNDWEIDDEKELKLILNEYMEGQKGQS